MKKEKLSVLIVDDEPEARDLLSMLVGKLEDVQIMGTAEGVDQAFALIVEKRPDLVLLDIQMPVRNGFELVRMVQEKKIRTGFVFVTAFDEYAIRAIRVSAFDYLLKPVDPAALKSALERFRSLVASRSLPEQIDLILHRIDGHKKVRVNTRAGFILLDTEELLYCRAEGNYTRIHMSGGRQELLSVSLGTFQERLPGNGFFRISRSAVIHLKFLQYVDKRAGTCTLMAAQPVTLHVARGKRELLERKCSGMS